MDQDHRHPIRLDIGDDRYCLISYETPPANIEFDWRVRENYDLNDILTLVGDSVAVHTKARVEGLSDDL